MRREHGWANSLTSQCPSACNLDETTPPPHFNHHRIDFREFLPRAPPREGHTELAAMEVARKTTLRATNTTPHTSMCRGLKTLPSPWCIANTEVALVLLPDSTPRLCPTSKRHCLGAKKKKKERKKGYAQPPNVTAFAHKTLSRHYQNTMQLTLPWTHNVMALYVPIYP